jgi:2-dehydro-3-deoxyphosphooctonate aldolase (KDO 8-P synthase)
MISGIKNIKNSASGNFFLIAGPCVVESEKIVFDIAQNLIDITDRLNIPFVFKASYRKANRSKLDSFTGLGDDKALKILQKIKQEFKLPICTDVHESKEIELVKEIADIIQIPAFLCRQTELLIAAGKSNCVVNIKKGQFLAPDSMKFAVDKVKNTGNSKIMLTERGSSFGYGDLIVDFRSIPIMQRNNLPVVLDITHSLQQPNTAKGVTGGQPEFIETIAKAGIAAGVNGIFLETHPTPSEALSDGANMLELDKIESLLEKLLRVQNSVK